MTIERAQLEKIANLARLQLDDSELDRLTHDCRSILDYFEAVRAVTSAPGDVDEEATPLREDRVSPDRLSGSPADIAPSWRDGYFLLPRLPALDADALDDHARDGEALDPDAPEPDALDG